MKTMKQTPPAGYELDLQASTSKEVVFKKVQNLEEAEKLFLEIITGMEFYPQQFHPNSVCWKKNGEVIFEQDFKNKYLLCDYDEVWSEFEPFFSKLEPFYDNNYNEVRKFIGGMVVKHLKWEGLTSEAAIFASWWKNKQINK